MSRSSAVAVLESLARRAEVLAEHGARDLAARTQVAFVRALVDEARRRPESDARTGALLTQIDEEVLRLARLLRGNDAAPPISETRVRVR